MRRVYKNLCPAMISASIMAANMWKNSLKNVESDNNKILYETLLDFFLQRNGTYFLNKPRTLINWRKISFHKVQKQSTFLNERQSLTELRVICSGRCEGKADFLTMRSHPNLSESVTRGQNSSVKCGDHVRSKAGTWPFTNVETVLYVHVLNVIAITRW